MEKSEPVENNEKALLSPDHPLLEKFQQTLRDHLLSQLERKKYEVFELETEAKKKTEQKDILGVQTYEVQQMVCEQQKSLENLVAQTETVISAKEEVDKGLEESKKNFKEIQNKFLESEKLTRELETEIESVNYLNSQMSEWEKRTESHIFVNKRIAMKTRKDYNIMFQEKKKQDMLIFNLTTAVWKLESQIETLTQENKIREKEVEELEQAVAVGNTNIEALQTEIRCLMHSWNSVVVAVSNRDKGLECLNEEFRNVQEKLKSICSEIEQVKKLTKKELNANERFTMVKMKIIGDIKYCQGQMDDEIFTKGVIEKNIIEMNCIIDQTEKDIQDCSAENEQKDATLGIVMRDFNKMVNKKNETEEKLMKTLENIMTSNKVATNLTRLLTKLKLQRRDVEVIMREAENKSSLLSTQIETQKYTNNQLSHFFDDIQQEENELMKETQYLQSENEKYQALLKKRERQVDSLVTKLSKETEKNVVTASPKEMIILELEKNIDEIQESIKKLQSFWLREQKNLLSVTEERQEQIQNISLLKKQMKILEQKNLNVNDELEALKLDQSKIVHNINNLQCKITSLCDTIFKKRNQKENLDKTNILIQTEYEIKLRDAELTVLQLEADIADIEDDKVNLSKELIEINREALEWEKKMQVTKETVNQFKSERSKTGELGTMKLEIHKMEVIYGQMKRAQEKLMKDLTYCISRRDNIFHVFDARMKKQLANKQVIDIYDMSPRLIIRRLSV